MGTILQRRHVRKADQIRGRFELLALLSALEQNRRHGCRRSSSANLAAWEGRFSELGAKPRTPLACQAVSRPVEVMGPWRWEWMGGPTMREIVGTATHRRCANHRLCFGSTPDRALHRACSLCAPLRTSVRTDNHRAKCRPWRQADGNQIANASRLGIVAVPLLEEAPWCQWRHEECKPHAALVGFSKRSSRAELERATGTEIKAAISFHFSRRQQRRVFSGRDGLQLPTRPPRGIPSFCCSYWQWRGGP
jgi:hypothetical protein